MPRWVVIAIGILVVGLAVRLAVRDARPTHADDTASSSGARDGGAWGRSHDGGLHDDSPGDDGGGIVSAYGDSGRSPENSGLVMVGDLAGLAPSAASADGGPGSTMPDGTPVGTLPATAPRQVRFGVVLVGYSGAQPTPGATRLATRSRADAKVLADKLTADAAQDFHAAVQQGDSGSTDDVGRVKLGILEPAAEYVLFTLPVGGVGGPVDTPRGYWIVKRLE